MLSYQFTPKTDEEIEAIKNQNLLPEGNYSFVIREAKQRLSSTGNPMIEVLISIVDNNGNNRNIKDYLLSTDKMIYKLKHLCDSIGVLKDYERGILDLVKFVNQKGQAKIIIQKGGVSADGSLYPDKNAVKDYLKRSEFVQLKSVEKETLLSDDIPF